MGKHYGLDFYGLFDSRVVDEQDTVSKSAEWDESQHPRDEHGRFGEGNSEPAQLTENQLFYLQAYAGSGYRVVNLLLRKGEDNATHLGSSSLQEAKDTISSLDRAFRTVDPTKEETVTYRGVKDGPFTDALKSAEVGDTFTDKGFVSTSKSNDVANIFTNGESEGAILNITIPAGEKVLDVNYHLSSTEGADYNTEKEVLLNRDTTFEITGKSGNVVDVKVVSNVR